MFLRLILEWYGSTRDNFIVSFIIHTENRIENSFDKVSSFRDTILNIVGTKDEKIIDSRDERNEVAGSWNLPHPRSANEEKRARGGGGSEALGGQVERTWNGEACGV